MHRTLVFSIVCPIVSVLTPLAYADQGSFTNSGGSTSASSGVVVNNSTTTPAGTLNLNCSPTTTDACAGGSFSYLSQDGTISINAVFTSGTYAETCSGGSGRVTCTYSFDGYISGTWTASGQSQGIVGVTHQTFGTGAAAATGTTGYNSAYAPFYYSDSEQILRSDDAMGTNQIAFGSEGNGVGRFYGAYGIALDSAGAIYIADTYNCRVVRMNDMTGTGWTTYGGTCGASPGQFSSPNGIAVDSAGKIYVMDTGNSRIVRIDDMSGANWITYGSLGSGTGQFNSFTSITVDASGKIYVPDTGNKRIVRLDDMSGTNWTVLTQSPPVNGVNYSFTSPVAVAVDAAGKIYVADNTSFAPAVVRVDNMTGLNWTSIYVSPSGSAGLNSISVDSGGTVYTGGGGVRFVDSMATVLTSSGTIGPLGTYYVFGVTPMPLPSPRPSAIGFAPPALTFSQNVGTTSAPQTLTISNFGGSPLSVNNVSANGGFAETNNCPGVLQGGSKCTVSVTFTPAASGTVNGTVAVTDNSYNLGGSQAVPLTGTGTIPGGSATVSPTTLNFGTVAVGSTSSPQTVTLTNGPGASLTFSNIATSTGFAISSNTCGTGIAAGASCTVGVTFSPTGGGTVNGTLTFSDSASNSPQTVSLSGTGSTLATLSTTSVNFGPTKIGQTTSTMTVTLTNSGGASLFFTSFSVSAGFAIASNTCGTNLAPGASCTVAVTFTPAAKGKLTGTLIFNDSAVNSPQTVSLTGAGVGK